MVCGFDRRLFIFGNIDRVFGIPKLNYCPSYGLVVPVCNNHSMSQSEISMYLNAIHLETFSGDLISQFLSFLTCARHRYKDGSWIVVNP